MGRGRIARMAVVVAGAAALGLAAGGVGLSTAIGTGALASPAAQGAVSADAGVSAVDWYGRDPGRAAPWGSVQAEPGWGGAYEDLGTAAATGSQTLSDAGSEAAGEVEPAVVTIDTVLDFGSAEAAGTGIVLTSDGLVLTNHHVVEGSTSIAATVVGTGATYAATVVGYDESVDVAVLQLDDASGLPVATLGDSDALELGELVVGVGNAGGAGEPTAVEGVVTALDQTITASDESGAGAQTLTGLIETDADIQSGQSGGPLVDEAGVVVGVNVAASFTWGSTDTTGYAIPIDTAAQAARRILAGEESATTHVGGSAFLGVVLGGESGWRAGTAAGGASTGRDITGAGVVVAGVVDGSAAEAAGLVAGDIVTQLHGAQVTSAQQLSALVDAHDVGDRVGLSWVDSTGEAHTAWVQLGEGPVG